MADYISSHSGLEIDSAVSAVADKVDKVTGKGLSTNDLTNELLTLLTTNKVKSIATDALNDKLVVTYTDDTVANLNINDIVTDVYVSGATLDATTNVLTLTSTSGGADVTVNLSDFVNSSELTTALATKPDVDDNTPSATNTYSSQHTQDLHNVQATAIANLATAQAQILNDDTTVITTTNQPLSFSVNIDSTDTSVMTLNATNDTFTFLKNASYNFTSAIQLASSTGQTRTITFEVIDVSDNSVLATQTATLDVASGSDIVVNTVTLLTIGKNAFPNAPVTASIRVRASGTGYTINGFTSIIASSSSYDVSADASGITFTPAGSIEATNVQTAIQEIDSEKVSKIVSTDNSIVRFDGITGDVQNSLITIDDGGNIEISTVGEGVILASPNGTRYKITVNDDGSLGKHTQESDFKTVGGQSIVGTGDIALNASGETLIDDETESVDSTWSSNNINNNIKKAVLLHEILYHE